MKKIYLPLLTILVIVSLGLNIFTIYEFNNVKTNESVNFSQKDFEKSIQKIIQKLEIYNNADYDYKSIVIMAESGLGLVNIVPELNTLEEDIGNRLPEGYKLYREKNPGNKTYLNYQGQRLSEKDILIEVNEWYGPY